mmetsp:Transcript_2523/g.7550  ORF Transcript_2523/g.7550 Transcript_2523/m.7550 type:complete len:235 (+) Transcript_2523:293-997(+)
MLTFVVSGRGIGCQRYSKLEIDRRRARLPHALGVKMVFTGIVEEVGQVRKLEDAAEGGVNLHVGAEKTLDGVALGDSISVNGTCLTVTNVDGSGFTFGLAPETLRRTNLGDLKEGSTINLERSLAANGRMGGHIVQGHVDATGVIRKVEPEKDALWFTIGCDRSLMKYIVPKGYIAVDGTSLTVCDVGDDYFTFTMIPFTQENVAIPAKETGDKVNLEVDITGKYIEKLLACRQ